jgi:hypothetical protein
MGTSFKHKSVNGVTGFALESFIRFLTGEKPLATKWENKTYTFYLKSSFFEVEKLQLIFKKFEKEFLVTIRDIKQLE